MLCCSDRAASHIVRQCRGELQPHNWHVRALIIGIVRAPDYFLLQSPRDDASHSIGNNSSEHSSSSNGQLLSLLMSRAVSLLHLILHVLSLEGIRFNLRLVLRSLTHGPLKQRHRPIHCHHMGSNGCARRHNPRWRYPSPLPGNVAYQIFVYW